MKETGKRKNGKGLIPAIALCVLLLSACGGSEGKDAETVPEQSSAVQSQETAPEASESETGSKASEAETGGNRDTESETGGNKDAASENGGTEDPASAVNGAPKEGAAQPAESNTDTKQPEAAQGTDNQHGRIEEVGDGSFKVREVFVSVGEEGHVAVGGDRNPSEYIEVIYTDETVFTVRSSSDMGITYTDSPGSAKDIKTGISIDVTGRRDGNIFYAQSIMLYNFE